jgi:hypothetical protein
MAQTTFQTLGFSESSIEKIHSWVSSANYNIAELKRLFELGFNAFSSNYCKNKLIEVRTIFSMLLDSVDLELGLRNSVSDLLFNSKCSGFRDFMSLTFGVKF